MGWNWNVGDAVRVINDDDATEQPRMGRIVAAAEDAVTVQYAEGDEEVFGQDAAELIKPDAT